MNNTNTQDLFNFRDYVLFLKDKLDNTKLSEVVWVHWDYWAWKTTTMNILKQLYQEDGWIDNILEYSAWRNYYNKEDTVWKALLYELAGKIYDIFDSGDIIINSEYFKWEITNEEKEKLKSLFKDILWDEKIDKLSKKDLAKDYIKNICLEIQYNLYQDIKDFNWKLSDWDSEFSNNKIWSTIKIWLLWIDLLYDKFLNYNNLLGSIISSFAPKESKNEWFLKSWETIFNLLEKEEQELKKAKIDSLEVIQRKFDILLSFYNLISGIKPLIIMVDDLDRILPEKSVEILEILRIFFEKSQKIHFICAIDIRVIEKWIERKFNQLNQWGDLSRIEFEEYLEKIITIPFDLPAIPLVDFDSENNIFWVDTLIDNEFKENNKEKKEILNELEIFIKDIDKKSIVEIYYSLNYVDNNKDKNIDVEEFNKKYEFIKTNLDNFKKFEINLVNETNKDFNNKIKYINSYVLKDIIKTWLQANPRKIKRFINVFEIYFKILIYRNKKYKLEENNINYENDSIFLAKMLIIKLEWDEIYKEFVRDKFFIGFLEQISRFDLWLEKENNNFEISYNLNKFIKKSKNYKLQNLYWMLSIEKYFWENYNIDNQEDQEKNESKESNLVTWIKDYIKNIYKIYYLFSCKDEDKVFLNENFKYVYKFNLLKYLYEKDEIKVSNYLKIIVSLSKENKDKKDRIKNSEEILQFFKKYLNEEKNNNKLNLKDIINKINTYEQ